MSSPLQAYLEMLLVFLIYLSLFAFMLLLEFQNNSIVQDDADITSLICHVLQLCRWQIYGVCKYHSVKSIQKTECILL